VDIILLDLMMPLADGRDVLAMLRLNQKTKEVPVIIMSNLNRDTFDLSMLDDQVMDYWIKSEITPKMLTDRLISFFS
jgi:CheY-like chemotaxis protein